MAALDAAQRANARWKRRLAEYETPPLDEGIHEALVEWIDKRRGGLPGLGRLGGRQLRRASCRLRLGWSSNGSGASALDDAAASSSSASVMTAGFAEYRTSPGFGLRLQPAELLERDVAAHQVARERPRRGAAR